MPLRSGWFVGSLVTAKSATNERRKFRSFVLSFVRRSFVRSSFVRSFVVCSFVCSFVRSFVCSKTRCRNLLSFVVRRSSFVVRRLLFCRRRRCCWKLGVVQNWDCAVPSPFSASICALRHRSSVRLFVRSFVRSFARPLFPLRRSCTHHSLPCWLVHCVATHYYW